MQQEQLRRCPKCHGRGYEIKWAVDAPYEADCLRCHGAGFLPPTDDDD
jgi:DnaJ-class molecular chaperone